MSWNTEPRHNALPVHASLEKLPQLHSSLGTPGIELDGKPMVCSSSKQLPTRMAIQQRHWWNQECGLQKPRLHPCNLQPAKSTYVRKYETKVMVEEAKNTLRN